MNDLQYQYNMKQRGDENKDKFQLKDYQLIQYQILRTNIIRIVWQTVRRITNKILEWEGNMFIVTTFQSIYISLCIS